MLKKALLSLTITLVYSLIPTVFAAPSHPYILMHCPAHCMPTHYKKGDTLLHCKCKLPLSKEEKECVSPCNFDKKTSMCNCPTTIDKTK